MFHRRSAPLRKEVGRTGEARRGARRRKVDVYGVRNETISSGSGCGGVFGPPPSIDLASVISGWGQTDARDWKRELTKIMPMHLQRLKKTRGGADIKSTAVVG